MILQKATTSTSKPKLTEACPGDPEELLAELESIRDSSRQSLDQLKTELAAALSSTEN